MSSYSITLIAERPVSSHERARLYAAKMRAAALDKVPLVVTPRLAAVALQCSEPSPPVSLASSIESVDKMDYTSEGALVSFRDHLAGLDVRMKQIDERAREPRVGEIFDTTAAGKGRLYDIYAEMRK